MIEMNAQVSFGSQLQYLPQDSFAQIPPKKFPTVKANKPMVRDISETMVNSLIVEWSCLSNVFLLEII